MFGKTYLRWISMSGIKQIWHLENYPDSKYQKTNKRQKTSHVVLQVERTVATG